MTRSDPTALFDVVFPRPGSSLRRSMAMLAAVPVLVITALGIATVHQALQSSAESGLRTQARIVASALAESAQFDYLHGNKLAARRSMQAVTAAEPSIRQISLLAGDRTPLLDFGEVPRGEGELSVEVPLQQVDAQQRARPGAPPTGYIRVFIAPSALEEQKSRAAIAWSAVLAFAGLATALIALAMARTISNPLQDLARSMSTLLHNAGLREDRRDCAGEIDAMRRATATLAEFLAGSPARQRNQVAAETRDLQAAVSAATKETRDKRRLLAAGDQLVEEERRRLASVIHDQLNPPIVAIRLFAEAIAGRASGLEQTDIALHARRIVALANEYYEGSQGLVRDLRPELLETLGLSGALGEMVRRMDEADSTCAFEYVACSPAPNLPATLSITAYRVVQEALTNIVKHARASHVTVRLDAADLPHHVRIIVADDGQGIESAQPRTWSGLGMIGMRERIERVDGVMSVASGHGKGTVLTFLL